MTTSLGGAPQTLGDAPRVTIGEEWLVEASGCRPAALRDRAALAALFDEIVRDLALHPVAPAAWHQFPGAGGITGALVLAESHLTVHTFPEHGSLCLNLFCCRPRPEWPFAERLAVRLGARWCEVRSA
ncbi:MAG TPA: S-adenosylmethionine decarboxylase, partial [Gemmatimonadaceae bacterium]|nr:S-adenosylmethionine decarboxylase [Gemmatimonadaceae bacterium]